VQAKCVFWAATIGLLSSTGAAYGQSTDPQTHQHPAPAAAGWRLMQDGAIHFMFNDQGGPRGGREFVVPNWWMGMWTRAHGASEFGINVMLSVDAATVGDDGYRKIFQAGEAFEGKPLIDRQHPHDFLMQLAGTWQRNFGSGHLRLAAAAAGEPTLGPVAFMHRPSASNLPLAPLGHHTFDSTHISFGVVTASVERGWWTAEGSVFNGREPNEHRWDVDFAALDSYAGRLWIRPHAGWEFQVSSGKLTEPEELVPGDAVRTTASGSWFRQYASGFSAVTVGYGVTNAHDELRHGVFGEFSIERGRHGLSARVERQDVEAAVLITGEVPDEHHDGVEEAATVSALTVSGVRRVMSVKGFEGAIGAQVGFHWTPTVLRPTHGNHPVSYQVFFRLRLPLGDMGRMWNMVMSRGHQTAQHDSAHR
jgi:hypothetical protein